MLLNVSRSPWAGSKPMDMWTSPSEQPVPYGTCGHAMDNTETMLPIA